MAPETPPVEQVAAEFGLRARLRAALPHMAPSMTKIAELLIQDPVLPIRLSIGDLAKRAGVSPATVTRLCHLVGYAGYLQLRVSAAADLGRQHAQSDWGVELTRMVDPDRNTTRAPDILRVLVAVSVQAIQTAADLIDLAALQRAASAIVTCDHLDIYASGGSGSAARALQENLYHLGVNAHAHSDVHLGLMSAVLLTRKSVAVAISTSGRTSETVEMLSMAGSRGALTVALTSDPLSPLADAADVSIQTAAAEGFLQGSSVGAKHIQLFTCDLLYLLVTQRLRKRADTNLALAAEAIKGHRSPLRADSATEALQGPSTDQPLDPKE